MANILIVDDEEYIRDILSARVEGHNHSASCAATFHEGVERIKTGMFDLVFLDVILPDGNGLDLLQLIRQLPSGPEVIIITAVGSLKGAEVAIKNGAWDYLSKPLKKEDIILRIERALAYREIKNKSKPRILETETIVGKSPAIKKCLKQLAQCVSSLSNVLLTGETGTGKEVFARAIHDNCSLSGDNFIVVDCAAMPKTLAESVLFGHVKGAFTGADHASDGLVAAADKGTLFLDEIGELPFSLQAAFLRVLQERCYRPVGSSKEKRSQFRLISATNRDLDRMVKKGRFRQDLLHRIRTFHIELPAVRDRKTDIPELSDFYLKKLCAGHGMAIKTLLPETTEILESYDWPGNVRELVHTIDQAIQNEPDAPFLYPFALPDHIRLNYVGQHLPDEPEVRQAESSAQTGGIEAILDTFLDKGPLPNLKDLRNQFFESIEKAYLATVLSRTGWDIDQAADILGVGKNRIYVLIRKYDLKS